MKSSSTENNIVPTLYITNTKPLHFETTYQAFTLLMKMNNFIGRLCRTKVCSNNISGPKTNSKKKV